MTAETNTRLLVLSAAFIAAVIGYFAQRYLVHERELVTGVLVWAAALAVFAWALWQGRHLSPTLDYDNEREASFQGKDTSPRLPLSVDGEGKAAAGERSHASQSTLSSPYLELALLALVLLVGIFFRLYRIESIPAGLNHDAAWNGLYAIRINHGVDYSPFVACCGAFGHETTFLYVIAFWQRIIGPEALAINLAGVTVGLATLVVFYLLMRRLFGVHVALVAVLLLGICGWHVTFSRAGWHAILIPLAEALVFYLLYLALDYRRWWLYALAGLAVGFSLDTYDAGKTIPVSAAVFILYLAIRERSFLATHLKGLVIYGAAALLAFAPLGWYVLNNWESYTGRSRAVWIGAQIDAAGSLQPLLNNLVDGLLIFNYRAHGDDFFVNEPLLDVPLSIFFLLGLVYSLTKLKQPRHVLLLTMTVLSLTNGFLSEPNGNRALAAVLPAMAYSALFLVLVWDWLRPLLSRYSLQLEGALAVVLLLVAYVSYDSYLGPDRRDQWGFYPETTRVGRYMKDIAPDYEIHAAAGNWPRDALTYLSYQNNGDDPFIWVYTYTTNAVDLARAPLSETKGTAFIVEANRNNDQVFALLNQRYPNAATDQIFYKDRGRDRLVANVLLVPPQREQPAGEAFRLPD